MNTKPRTFLIDGSALLFRSFYAMQRMPLTTRDGVSVGAVYQFFNLLLRMMANESPDRIIMFFDTPAPTFRHEKYPEYKANRSAMPDELAHQIPLIEELIDQMQMTRIAQPGLEADDLLSAYAHYFADRGEQVYIVTADKDLMQSVTDDIHLYSMKTGGEHEIIDREGVRKKFAVRPEQVPDILGLWGDSSDNIPGVPRVGEKTAKELIGRFGSLERLYEHLDEVSKPSIRKSLRLHREQAFLSRELATIRRDAELPLAPEAISDPDLSGEELQERFRHYGFSSLMKFLSVEKNELEQDYTTIESRDQLKQLLSELRAAGEFAFDLETTSLDTLNAEIVGFSFALAGGRAWYLPARFNGRHGDLFQEDDLEQNLNLLRPLLENPDITKIGQNAKYDIHVLRNYDIRAEGFRFDTMIASFLIAPHQRRHNLDALSLQYLNYEKVPTEALIGKGAKQISMRDVPLEKISFYACEDADMTYRLKTILHPKLQEYGLLSLLEDMEIPLMEALVDMEREGITVDTTWLQQLREQYSQRLITLENEIYEIAGEKFNIGSPKQLAVILFDKFKLPHGKKGKTGYSTDMTVLEKLAPLDPLPQRILEHRKLSKLLSTYIDAYFDLINPRTGKIHTSFNQTIAATGRLSSTEPNLQNIPIRTEEGREIRRAFVVSTPDHILLDVDYSQIELRLFAHLAEDEALIQVFQQGGDIHRSTAAAVFKVPEQEITGDQRRYAKVINFGIMYGMGAYRLAGELSISQAEAREFINEYFNRFPGVRSFIDATIEQAREQGFVQTMFGRRRYLPDIASSNRQLREYAERAAVNSVVQGSAADLIKRSMIQLHRIWRQEEPDLRMLLQVHDELLFEIPVERKNELAARVKQVMEGVVTLRVPLVADHGFGRNWLEAH